MKTAVLVLAAFAGTAVAFAPVRHATGVQRGSTLNFSPTDEQKAAYALVEDKMSAVEYLDTLYGGLGEPETGGKIPPLAYECVKLGTPGTVDFMRAAELKHARIAMIGFMGWVANLQNVHFPGMLSVSKGVAFADLEKVDGVTAFFTQTPALGIAQILMFCAVFEWYDMSHVDGKWAGNNALMGGMKANMNKWDILAFTDGKTEDDLKRVKLQELKNGRLAMMGTLGCVAAATIPGSVPFLTPYF